MVSGTFMTDQSERDLYCPKCGYNVRGLEDSLCPECGSEFNRTELLQVPQVQPISLGRALLRLLWLPVASTLLGILVGVMLDKGDGATALLGVLPGFGLLIAALISTRKLSQQLAVGRAERLGIAPF